jgi:hypothetical protein
MMGSNSVNKTALHPGGVQYVIPFQEKKSLLIMDRPSREHTELEEELHETAHIDYDRVAIARQSSKASAKQILTIIRLPIPPSRPSMKMPSSTKLGLQ